MNTVLCRPLIWLCSAFLALSGCATAPQQPEIPGTLKVSVNVPPSWNMLVEDRVSQALTDQVRDVFSRAGFDRPIQEMRYVEDPAKLPYLLTINLVDWRTDRIGNIDCTFSATLQTPRGNRDFGLFSNMTMRWSGGLGRWGLEQSFNVAAAGAVHDLCEAVLKSEMLPSFQRHDLYAAKRESVSPQT